MPNILQRMESGVCVWGLAGGGREACIIIDQPLWLFSRTCGEEDRTSHDSWNEVAITALR